MASAKVKVRVSSQEDIPWFFVFTEGTAFESDNCTVQCEIFQSNMLGQAPQDEDFPPGDGGFNPQHFHYFGFGQAGQGPPPSPPQDNNPPNAEFGEALGLGGP